MCASHPPPPKLRICYSHRQACAARERCDGRALSSTSTSWCRFGQLNRRRQLHLGTPAGHTVKQMLTPRYICLTEIQAHSFILRNAIAIRDWPPQGTILCGRRGGGGGGGDGEEPEPAPNSTSSLFFSSRSPIRLTVRLPPSRPFVRLWGIAETAA